jgi:hypothetical protein
MPLEPRQQWMALGIVLVVIVVTGWIILDAVME